MNDIVAWKELSDIEGELSDNYEAMRRAICIYVRENAGSKIEFANDIEAIRWFIEYADILDRVTPDPDKERSHIKGFES